MKHSLVAKHIYVKVLSNISIIPKCVDKECYRVERLHVERRCLIVRKISTKFSAVYIYK